MKKRQFGMAVMNITQGRYTGISHKLFNAYDLAGMDSGVDRFKAFMPLEVIGVHRFDYSTKRGFANTVHFYDKENDITIAMTHQNKLDGRIYKVGKVFNPGDTIYYEGTAGQATGNHIHLEIGRGRQSVKVKKGRDYVLDNWVNIEDYFWVNPEYTKVAKSAGYEFQTQPEPQSAPKAIGTLTVHTVGLNIRDSIQGNILGFIAPGKSVELVDFVEGIQRDGYQWVKVLFGSTEAYAQYDSRCYSIELKGDK